MYCPKCGQSLIHINDREICTACGVTYDDNALKDQVIDRTKAKATKKIEHINQNEDKYSLQAKKENIEKIAENEIKESVTQEEPSKESMEKLKEIQKKLEIKDREESLKELKEIQQKVESVTPEATKKQVPDFPFYSNADNSIDKLARVQKEQRDRLNYEPTKVIMPEDKNVPQQTGNISLEKAESKLHHLPAVNSTKEKVVQRKISPTPQNFEQPQLNQSYQTKAPVKKNKDALYPSHEISHVFIKTMFYLVLAVAIIGGLFFLYLMIDGIKGLVDGIIVRVGESLVK